METMTIKDRIIKEVYSRVLEELLLQKELSDVTTTEIIEHSGLSRNTFYKYFKDKFELANWKYSCLLDSIAKEYISPNDTVDILREIVFFVDSHRLVFSRLLKYTGQNSFSEYNTKYAFSLAEELARRAGRQLSLKDYYVIHYHSAAILHIICEWILSGDPLSAAEIMEIIHENRSEMVKMLYIC